MGSGNGFYSGGEFSLDPKWLVDPKLLFVGPKIGEGAHAKVYEGKYKNQNVATKLFTEEIHQKRLQEEARFGREVAMLSRVQHKNLVKEPVMVIVTELLLWDTCGLRKYLLNIRPRCLDMRVAIGLLLTLSHGNVCTRTGSYIATLNLLYSTVTLRHGEKKHYNHKVDAYSFAIVLWELIHNKLPFEGMSNLQAAYAAAFKNVRPSAEDLPQDLALICYVMLEGGPLTRPNFSQIIQMLLHYLSISHSPPEPIIHTRISTSENAVFHRVSRHQLTDGQTGTPRHYTPKTPMETEKGSSSASPVLLISTRRRYSPTL
ncbi:UNVERIFIED_CONTAM: putative serine/threonine-protein kinase roco7 [Sesamum radiatum]|uniref:Serine/threonine-protein kinase roco7 n=1 Tax=Sesamum radiatum TaxID=300843 RepID=A0AAW2V5M8_SESRA